jgi:hypothetical protein
VGQWYPRKPCTDIPFDVASLTVVLCLYQIIRLHIAVLKIDSMSSSWVCEFHLKGVSGPRNHHGQAKFPHILISVPWISILYHCQLLHDNELLSIVSFSHPNFQWPDIRPSEIYLSPSIRRYRPSTISTFTSNDDFQQWSHHVELAIVSQS